MKTTTKIVYDTLALLALNCFALLSTARAVVPPPDGGYPGGNTAEGQSALFSLTTGTGNTALGGFSLFSDTTGIDNTAVGLNALRRNILGQLNTAVGFNALFFNDLAGTGSGSNNSAVGAYALFFNTTGHDNSAFGQGALAFNSTGIFNTAIGATALFSNSTGHNNTATGESALFSSTTGSANTANGSKALFHNTNGNSNTALGSSALVTNTGGSNNTAIGSGSLSLNTFGGNNTAIGTDALRNNTSGIFNTANGYQALFNNITGSGNTGLGVNAGSAVTTASNVIAIGTTAADVSNSCFVGNIRGVTTANSNAVPVLIDSAGQLGTTSSSRRFKKEIQSMDKASEDVLALKPVTFHYKTDNTLTPQFGLIAEEVAEVDPDLVVRDKNGEIYSVRYDAVNAMLLNEFLKEHCKVQELEATVAQQQKRCSKQEEQIAALKSGLQKVRVQVGVSKSSQQMASRNARNFVGTARESRD